jgi:hypothetical protein
MSTESPPLGVPADTGATQREGNAVLGITAPDCAPAPARDGWAHRFRHWFLFWPVVAYVAARIVTLAALAATAPIKHHTLYGRLVRWDSQWFLRAAENGWPRHLPMIHGHVAGNTTAFFPVFPLAMRWVSSATSLSPLAVGVTISGVTGLTAVMAIGVLVRRFAGSEGATRAALLFALFPGTFAFSLAYNEGIVLTCIALGLMALMDRRWWLAGLLGMVATATAPISLAFVLSCAWCAGWASWRNRSVRPLVAPVLAASGFVAYMVWLWRHTRTLDAWRLTERGGWKSSPSLSYPFRIIWAFVRNPVSPTITGQILFFGTVVAIVGAVLAIRQRQPAPVLIYGLAAGVLGAISAPVGLRPRFVMLAFPLVVAYGTRLRGRAYTAALVVSGVLLVAMTVLEFVSLEVFP